MLTDQSREGAMHGSHVLHVLVLRLNVALYVAAVGAVIAVRALKGLFGGATRSEGLFATLARAWWRHPRKS
jgi:nitrogen fixation protein FixH